VHAASVVAAAEAAWPVVAGGTVQAEAATSADNFTLQLCSSWTRGASSASSPLRQHALASRAACCAVSGADSSGAAWPAAANLRRFDYLPDSHHWALQHCTSTLTHRCNTCSSEMTLMQTFRPSALPTNTPQAVAHCRLQHQEGKVWLVLERGGTSHRQDAKCGGGIRVGAGCQCCGHVRPLQCHAHLRNVGMQHGKHAREQVLCIVGLHQGTQPAR
jgi:hypothetical protein